MSEAIPSLTNTWRGRRVKYAGHGPAVIERAIVCEDRAGLPYVAFHVKGDYWESIWPASQCEVMEE